MHMSFHEQATNEKHLKMVKVLLDLDGQYNIYGLERRQCLSRSKNRDKQNAFFQRQKRMRRDFLDCHVTMTIHPLYKGGNYLLTPYSCLSVQLNINLTLNHPGIISDMYKFVNIKCF